MLLRLKLLLVSLCVLALAPVASVAQTVVDTVAVGPTPTSIAVNPTTNKIYVADSTGSSLTVIDGATDQTTTVSLSANPTAVAVNPVTNKVFVSLTGSSVAVIDGATLAVTNVTVPAGPGPLAVNTVTNKVYVTTFYSTANMLTEIDGTTLATISLGASGTLGIPAVNLVTNNVYMSVGPNGLAIVLAKPGQLTYQTVLTLPNISPTALAVNNLATKNKIYVGDTQHTVTVVDGSTFGTQTIHVGNNPTTIAVNANSNLIYVANSGDRTVTVINGTTVTVTATVPVALSPTSLAVNQSSGVVYAASTQVQSGHSIVTVINTNDSTVDVQVGNVSAGIATNPATNRTYVSNMSDNTVSVIGGSALHFVPLVPPCRAFDTRNSQAIQGGTSQNFAIAGTCGVPPTAAAYSLNIGAIPHGRLGFLTVWPAGGDRPNVSTLNSPDGRIKSNAAIIPAGVDEKISVYVTNTSDVFGDVNGYFVSDISKQEFYPLPPCRVIDTRNANGDLAGPFLSAKVERDFPVLESSCLSTAVGAQAYSFNVTVVPHPHGQRLGFLTVWPEGGARPTVSTLNNPTGTNVANAAIVTSGTNGGIAVYPTDDTDLVIDINGYFAAPGSGGLSLYTASPCRVLDTRTVGNGQPFMGELTVNVEGSVCTPPASATGYVFNATVVPPQRLGFLTLWPDGQQQPTVSTLNAIDGLITNNMAIVQTMNGSIDAFASDKTQLILDLFGYFAP